MWTVLSKIKFKVKMIDWASARWYPSYWDYALSLCSIDWDDDWELWISTMLSPYHSEAPLFQMLRFELWS